MGRVKITDFDPQEVARAEVGLWQSYYNHQFAKMFIQIFKVMHSQLHPGKLSALRLMWHAGIATARFRLKRGHEDYDQVLKSMTKYYKLISRHSSRPFDYRKAAEAELVWWDKHRYPDKYKMTLAETLAAPMAIIYGVDPKLLSDYGKFRAQAADIVTHEIEKHQDKNDWVAIEKLLIKSWSSLHSAVTRNS
jgi:hypothetical protein